LLKNSAFLFMPTLQDVARLAGVSTATVSKVLSNTPYFSEDTRERVMLAVRELGYRPNLAGRALSRGKTGIVGVIFPYVYDSIFKDPVVLAIIEGIEEELSRQGYNLLLNSPHLTYIDEDESFMQLLRGGYLDGMIAIDSVPGSRLADTVKVFSVPLVVLGYHNAPYQVHCDDFTGGCLIAQHLLNLGHQRIGVIGVPASKNLAVNERMRGLRHTLAAAGLDNNLPFAEGDYSTRSGYAAAAALVEAHPQLTAITCMNDRMAIGAMHCLQARGYRVPQDMTVVGYDNLGISEMTMPPLTTVSQHAGQLGRTSAQMLIDVLKDITPSIAVIAPTLIERASSAPPREMDFVPLGQG
jgi:DNA-binding LacI/PurR family transcriptional regulator